ncbi:riboflavin kinase / FMN adenylyltransferase [Propionibacterium cyclohexanicum]|uniref:Riboflavin biosynthesis protein n=1 Tax=Propionibacterium cyclohexanicum TaxID=64702 RepID=A0A1H9PQL9_9ACTN|nr:bifunctional riboflavin kinase/FAD synthetase [Propionibacterium cyclohexanicum]SER49863.1 riboflavin kinase / FMN adenylyltransferase [Propionibacterium cyclohexanicum]
MPRSVVVIGNFDGVHRGHQVLLAKAVGLAEELGEAGPALPVIAVTLWPHPMTVLAPDRAPRLLCTLEERIELLKRYGANQVRVVQFNREVTAWSPAHFVDTVLRPLDPAAVVVGSNFTFGRGARGNPAVLRELLGPQIPVIDLDLLEISERPSSSSLIRTALDEGDVGLAARHLGRWFRLSGVVLLGDQRGRSLGFPTANLPVFHDLACPADGVYAGWLTVLEDTPAQPLPAAVSVGTNPTFDGVERRVESYVLDRTDLQLYGVRIAVDFVSQLRGQLRFGDVQELVAQMDRDVEQTRAVLSGAQLGSV